MPHEGSKKRGGLKRNLALPGESNRAKILGGRGQVQDQASKIVSEKALEQPLVKPGGLRRTVGRVGRAIREVGLQPSAIATNLLTKGKAAGDRIVSPAITEGEVATATRKRKKKPEQRQIGTSVLTEEGGVSTLRGTRKPAPDIDFTRGTAKEVAIAKRAQARALAKTGRGRGGVRRGGGGIDIFASAGRLAESLASPEAQAERKLARGITAGRKGRRADVKLVNERIKALSSTLANIPDLEENEEIRNRITTQITDLITKGTADQKDPVLAFAEQAKKAGFGSDEIKSLATRLFPQA